MALDYGVVSLPPSSFLKGDEQGPDVPKETKAAKTMKPLYSSIRKQDDSVELRFAVIYPYPYQLYCFPESGTWKLCVNCRWAGPNLSIGRVACAFSRLFDAKCVK